MSGCTEELRWPDEPLVPIETRPGRKRPRIDRQVSEPRRYVPPTPEALLSKFEDDVPDFAEDTDLSVWPSDDGALPPWPRDQGWRLSLWEEKARPVSDKAPALPSIVDDDDFEQAETTLRPSTSESTAPCRTYAPSLTTIRAASAEFEAFAAAQQQRAREIRYALLGAGLLAATVLIWAFTPNEPTATPAPPVQMAAAPPELEASEPEAAELPAAAAPATQDAVVVESADELPEALDFTLSETADEDVEEPGEPEAEQEPAPRRERVTRRRARRRAAPMRASMRTSRARRASRRASSIRRARTRRASTMRRARTRRVAQMTTPEIEERTSFRRRARTRR